MNGVAPGFVPTELVEGALGNPQFVQMMLRRIPFGRFGAPAEMAAAALLRQPGGELRHRPGAVRGRRRDGELVRIAVASSESAFAASG